MTKKWPLTSSLSVQVVWSFIFLFVSASWSRCLQQTFRKWHHWFRTGSKTAYSSWGKIPFPYSQKVRIGWTLVEFFCFVFYTCRVDLLLSCCFGRKVSWSLGWLTDWLFDSIFFIWFVVAVVVVFVCFPHRTPAHSQLCKYASRLPRTFWQGNFFNEYTFTLGQFCSNYT